MWPRGADLQHLPALHHRIGLCLTQRRGTARPAAPLFCIWPGSMRGYSLSAGRFRPHRHRQRHRRPIPEHHRKCQGRQRSSHYRDAAPFCRALYRPVRLTIDRISYSLRRGNVTLCSRRRYRAHLSPPGLPDQKEADAAGESSVNTLICNWDAGRTSGTSKASDISQKRQFHLSKAADYFLTITKFAEWTN